MTRVAPAEPSRLPAGHHGLPREVVIRSQRERILEAMIRSVAARGYDQTTVADVIRLAGVSRKTFYEHYADKEECFLAAYDAVVDVLVHTVGTAYRQHQGTWPERVYAGITALAELMVEEADIARTAIVEAPAAGPTVRQRYRDALMRFTPFLDEGRAFSEFTGVLPANASRIAVGGVAALLFDEIHAGRTENLVGVVPDLVFAALLPLVGPEVAMREMNGPADKGDGRDGPRDADV